MPKDTKSLGNNKVPACESRGFVLKKKKVRILTHLLLMWTSLGLNQGPPDYENDKMIFYDSLFY